MQDEPTVAAAAQRSVIAFVGGSDHRVSVQFVEKDKEIVGEICSFLSLLLPSELNCLCRTKYRSQCGGGRKHAHPRPDRSCGTRQ